MIDLNLAPVEVLEPLSVWSDHRIELELGLSLEGLNPLPATSRFPSSDTNKHAVVLRLVYRDINILFASDIESEAESRIPAKGAALTAMS